MTYDFTAQQTAWSAPPVEGTGYVSSAELLTFADDELLAVATKMRQERYSVTRWRNHDNLWRTHLGLDETIGKRVLDFGCGAGLEALEYGRAGNDVTVADISATNLKLAQRFFAVHDVAEPIAHLVTVEYPFIGDGRYDVIHCSGVLHHIPYPDQILARFSELLAPGGEVRLMVYSDEGWRNATGTEPPDDTAAHPEFGTFVRYFDRVGSYADWYDRAKLERLAAPGLAVTGWWYITPSRGYAVARLTHP